MSKTLAGNLYEPDGTAAIGTLRFKAQASNSDNSLSKATYVDEELDASGAYSVTLLDGEYRVEFRQEDENGVGSPVWSSTLTVTSAINADLLVSLGQQGAPTVPAVLSAEKTDTGTTGPATIEDVARLGVAKSILTPSGATSAVIGTGLMRETEASSENGAWTGDSHPVGGFDRLVLNGTNTFQQAFGHEIRIENNCTGAISELTGYKPVYIAATGTSVVKFIDYPDVAVTLNGTAAITDHFYCDVSADRRSRFNGTVEVRDLDFDATVAGTTGNQTINKSAGRVTIAASGQQVTVTNSLVTANSIILTTLADLDGTAFYAPVAIASSGSFTITLPVAATSDVDVNFLIIN